MIQELCIKNFLSFKDEMKFSFEASGDTFAESHQVVKINENTRLLRFAVVYGYNASGKSNLLKAFEFLSDFWFSRKKDIDQVTGNTPFKLDQHSPKEPTLFELIFYVGPTKYRYYLKLDTQAVYLEKLSYYKSTQPILLFERKLENGQSVISFNPALKISSSVKEKITLECFKNMSFFAARNQVNVSIPLIDDAKDWMKRCMMSNITPSIDLTFYAQKKSSENDRMTDYIVNFLNTADFNITNIHTEVTHKSMPAELKDLLLHSDGLPDELKKMLNAESLKQVKTRFEHTVENDNGVETYMMNADEKDESRGTLRTFGIEAALYQALQDNAFLGIDEVETSLHPKLLEKILFEYLQADSQSQLLVTTHNDGLLDLVDDLIRKDSVWFTEKKKSGATDLYKLTDFRGINRLASIREAYRNKRFGATMK